MKGVIAGLFLLLLAGAVIFSLERILFADASYILFRIINMDILQIQQQRYGSFITQAVPLLASRMDLPLIWIVVLYSASFNLFYLAVALLLLFVFRQIPLAILMAFYYTLVVTETWFWTNNEVHQGIAWMFLSFGLFLHCLEKKYHPAITTLVFIPTAFLAIFTHPLVMLPFVFLWFFLLFANIIRLHRGWVIILTVMLAFICLWKLKESTETQMYDKEKLTPFFSLSLQMIYDSVTSPMMKIMVKRFFTHYWWVPLLFTAGIWTALKNRAWIPAIITGVFCLVYTILAAVTYRDFEAFYTESEWMAFSVIATAPFVYFTLPLLRPKAAMLVVGFILLTRIIHIGMSAERFISRKHRLYEHLREMRTEGITKGFLEENDRNRYDFIMNWGVPVESLIASALQKDRPNLTFVITTEENFRERLPDNNQMISSFEPWHYRNMDNRYFSIDTTASYRQLKK